MMPANPRDVSVFFYGSFMNDKVLSKASISPRNLRRAKLSGFSIVVSPRATIAPEKHSSVYGLVGELSHPELDKIYAKDWFGFGSYVPEAVVLEEEGRLETPALCYICWDMAPYLASRDYLSLMLEVGQRYGFPAGYLEEISSFGKV